MIIQIELKSYEGEILKKISDYSEILPENICKQLITNFLLEFDVKMTEFMDYNGFENPLH